jgi:hypothetical protein
LAAILVLADPTNLLRCTAANLPTSLRNNPLPEEKESEDAGKPVLSSSGGRHVARKRPVVVPLREDLSFPLGQLASSAFPCFSSLPFLPGRAISSGAVIPLRC